MNGTDEKRFYGQRAVSLDELVSLLVGQIGYYMKRRQVRLKGMTPMDYQRHALAACG
ncbi:IS3 family transposase [Glutamicibacter arilaitensis]|uniref:IS3 family transposase n=1 Tax=Glutamicibacter arilaitensis TaxID=256701 RepID=UPI003FD3017D